MDVSGKLSHLDINGKLRKFSIDKLKPFRRDDQTLLESFTTLAHGSPERTNLREIYRAMDDSRGCYDTKYKAMNLF